MLSDKLRRFWARRQLLQMGVGSAVGLTGAALLGRAAESQTAHPAAEHVPFDHGASLLVGQVNHDANGFDPLQVLVDWDYGTVSTLPDGRTLREYELVAFDREIEIAPGLYFPAWTFNGRVPGPTLRCTEGDHIRIHFINAGTHPHTMHFHGFHTAENDGIPNVGPGEIQPGQEFTYEFDAEPFGCHLYHCHAVPLKRHIHKGLYGAFIIDPKAGRPPARELLMIMNAFDTNFDGDNEIYAVNTVGHEYAKRPIPLKVGERVRIYLINITEFDPINSMHLHATFFDYYDHGTTLEPTLRTVDTVMQCQAQRGILEFTYRWPGHYMFHAHQSEFVELGWMGMFHVVEEADFPAALEASGLDAEWDRKSTQGSTVAMLPQTEQQEEPQEEKLS
ncbi:MAG TPA: multicopper oxidase domain-containing protein [Caldilineaceae bacterium]|nr:multicopper oxidase domain-containing protein [Caldilineaceae bacterium]